MELTPTVTLHLSAAIAALATGPVALYARLGPRPRPRLHRLFGRLWVGLMLVTAISALFLRDTGLPNVAGFTPVHLLVPVTFGALARAFLLLARGDRRGHAATMRWLYLLACVGAGAFTLLPHRLLGSLLWSRLALLSPIVQHTPQWVWLLLAGLLLAGWVQSRDRRASLASVTATPVAMTLFSLWAAIAAFGRGGLLQEVLALWLAAAVLVGVPLSQRRARAWYEPPTRSFDLAGSWLPMLLFVSVFATRYGVAVRLALDPALAAEPAFALPIAMLYGAFSGVFLGRAAQLWRLALRPAAVPAA